MMTQAFYQGTPLGVSYTRRWGNGTGRQVTDHPKGNTLLFAIWMLAFLVLLEFLRLGLNKYIWNRIHPKG